MRIAVKLVGIVHLLTAAFVVLVCVREFIVVYMGAYGTTAIRTAFFVALLFLGLLGGAGSIRLLQRQDLGRKLTLAYLILLVPILVFLPETPGLVVYTPLWTVLLSIGILASPLGRSACRPPPEKL
jgi:hypothetical protein